MVSKGSFKGNAGEIWCLFLKMHVHVGVCVVTAVAKRMIKELHCSED